MDKNRPTIRDNRAVNATVPDFEKFRALVLEDVALQDRLLAEREAEPFISLVVDLAHERGLSVTAAEVRAALTEARRSWFERRVR
jgi:hypothetical protein